MCSVSKPYTRLQYTTQFYSLHQNVNIYCFFPDATWELVITCLGLIWFWNSLLRNKYDRTTHNKNTNNNSNNTMAPAGSPKVGSGYFVPYSSRTSHLLFIFSFVKCDKSGWQSQAVRPNTVLGHSAMVGWIGLA